MHISRNVNLVEAMSSNIDERRVLFCKNDKYKKAGSMGVSLKS